MKPLFIEEMIRLFFNHCSNNPQSFVDIFNRSTSIIGYNFRCSEHRFTHVSNSFKGILGYNQQNILNNENFISKIVHPQDKDVINECLKKSIYSSITTSQLSDFYQFEKVKCRAKHIRGNWKYFIIYAQGYWNDLGKSNDKIGLIVDERIRSISENEKGNDAAADSIDLNRNNPKSRKTNFTKFTKNIFPRENEVLEMISNGLVSKEIANQLHISDSTVITHRKNLITKLNVRNTAELIKKAALHMLI